MGNPLPPIDTVDLASWRCFSNAMSHSDTRDEVDPLFSAGNHVDKIGWEETATSGEYEGGFRFDSADKAVFLEYGSKATPPAIPPDKLEVTTANETAGSSNLIATVEEYDFLAYVLDQEPSGLVDELSSKKLIGLDCSHLGSDYKVVCTFTDGSTNTQKVASATLSGGSFGSITVT